MVLRTEVLLEFALSFVTHFRSVCGVAVLRSAVASSWDVAASRPVSSRERLLPPCLCSATGWVTIGEGSAAHEQVGALGEVGD